MLGGWQMNRPSSGACQKTYFPTYFVLDTSSSNVYNENFERSELWGFGGLPPLTMDDVQSAPLLRTGNFGTGIFSLGLEI